MKKLIILIVFSIHIGIASSQNAIDERRENIHNVSDPEYEWSQTINKTAKVELKESGLFLMSKGSMASSIIELPINVKDDDFIYGINLHGCNNVTDISKISSKISAKSKSFTALLGTNSLGIIFDYEDNNNYKGLTIFKKQFEYFNVKEGVVSAIKTGLIKHSGNNYLITMHRKGGTTTFMLGDMDICKVKNLTLENPYFGVFITGKMKALMPTFIYNVEIPENTESPTSSN